jgi:hypothetical protein
MMLPPLTAEVSLYKSSRHYRSSWSAGSAGGVEPSLDQGYPWDCFECLIVTCADSFWCQACDYSAFLPPPVDVIAIIGCYLACCGAAGYEECGGLC